MNNKPSKKRLCWNCEGNVSVDAETCPYCGVSVVPASLENVNTGFTPSYKEGGTHDTAIPRSPYVSEEKMEETMATEQEPIKEIEENAPAYDEFQRTLFATMLLLTGSVLFIFSLALMLFSHNGVFILKWDGTLWYVYLVVAFPLLLTGWRFLSKLDSDKSL